MYLRFTQRANTDGSVVRYVALAHNRRVDGRVKPDVLMNLGRADRLDVAGLRRLADSINKHFGDGGELSDASEAGLATGTAPIEVVDARPIGAAWLRTGCGSGWRSTGRCGKSWAGGGSRPMWSGCCSRWSPTGRPSR
jgi:hypothetical protein